MNRRNFIGNSAIGALGLGVLTGIYSWQVEPFWLEFVEREMRIKNLPESLDGRTLMQISDLHVGNYFNHSFIIESLREAQGYDPDFVVYTGDYITYESQEQFDQLDEVLKHAVKGKFGTLGILGNHDYGRNWSDQSIADRVSGQLVKAGIEVLKNRKTHLAGMDFIGFDDYWSANFQPKLISQEYNIEAPSVVLCHNPDVCDLKIWQTFDGWILSGHTHGGQINPPFLKPPLLPVKNKRYTSGEFDLEDGRKLYINRALGHLLQVRLNVRPEITIFRLGRA